MHPHVVESSEDGVQSHVVHMLESCRLLGRCQLSVSDLFGPGNRRLTGAKSGLRILLGVARQGVWRDSINEEA